MNFCVTKAESHVCITPNFEVGENLFHSVHLLSLPQQ